jgi:Flp pilus assembly protein TadD
MIENGSRAGYNLTTIHVMPPLAGPESNGSFALWREKYPKFGALIDQGASPLATLRYLGLLLWQDGCLDDAASVLTKAATLAPNEPTILGELGGVLRAAGQKTNAMRYLTASLKLDPKQPLVWLNVAGLCNETGDKISAEDAFRAALELEPASAEAAAGLGLLYIEWRRFGDAARLLSAAAERGVTTPAIYACLGQTLYLLGDFSNASNALEKAARACPDEARIIQKYAQARLTEAIIEHSVDEKSRSTSRLRVVTPKS